MTRENEFFPFMTDLIRTRVPNLRDAVHATSDGCADRTELKPLGESVEKLVPTSPDGSSLPATLHKLTNGFHDMGHR